MASVSFSLAFSCVDHSERSPHLVAHQIQKNLASVESFVQPFGSALHPLLPTAMIFHHNYCVLQGMASVPEHRLTTPTDYTWRSPNRNSPGECPTEAQSGGGGSISVTVPGNRFRFIDSLICLASFTVAALISDRSSPTRFFRSETLRCDFSEARSGIGVINCFFFLVRRCGNDTTTTSSALEIFADLLRIKIVNIELTSTLLKQTKSSRGIMSSALDITDLLRELRLKTANRGLTSTLLEISTDLLRELPSRLNGMNIVFRLNKATVFARNTPLRSEDRIRRPRRPCSSA
nr:hypothetical protein Iba_chr12cCG9570 [Ipomoea batatas]